MSTLILLTVISITASMIIFTLPILITTHICLRSLHGRSGRWVWIKMCVKVYWAVHSLLTDWFELYVVSVAGNACDNGRKEDGQVCVLCGSEEGGGSSSQGYVWLGEDTLSFCALQKTIPLRVAVGDGVVQACQFSFRQISAFFTRKSVVKKKRVSAQKCLQFNPFSTEASAAWAACPA